MWFETLPVAPLSPSHDHIILQPAAARTYQPLAPIEEGHFGAVPSRHLDGIGVDLMTATIANDQPLAAAPASSVAGEPVRISSSNRTDAIEHYRVHYRIPGPS